MNKLESSDIYILGNINKIYSTVNIWMKLSIIRPTSSVEYEKSTSMRIVKNWLRNSMGKKDTG